MRDQKGQALVSLIAFVVMVGIIFSVAVLGLPYQNIFVIFLGLFIFIISFLRTDIALVIIILSMLLSPELRAGDVPSRMINVRAEDFLIFIVFLGWIAKMAVKKELGFLRRNPLNTPITLYFTLCVVSSLLGLLEGRILFQESALYLLKYLEYYLLFFMAANNLRTYKQAKVYLYFILFTCFAVCLLAWLQIPAGERLTTPFETGGAEPNTLAGYLLLMMALVLSFLLHAQTFRGKLFWFGFFGFTAVPFVLTLSREGWFSFFPMILAFMVLHRKSRLFMLLALIIALIITPALLPKKVHERLQDTFYKYKRYEILGKSFHVSESTASRIESWTTGFTKLGQKPVLGWGVPGGGTIDNQYTRVLTETGVMGGLVYTWLMVLLFQLAHKTYRQMEDDNFAKAISLGFMCGFIGLLAQAMGAAVFVLIRIMEPFWFLAAIIVSLPEIAAEEKGLEYAGSTV